MREVVCEACGTRYPERNLGTEGPSWGTIVVDVLLNCAVDKSAGMLDVKIVKDVCATKRACVEKALASATQEALKSAIGKRAAG